MVLFFFEGSGAHRDLHVLAHAFPTRRSSDRNRTACSASAASAAAAAPSGVPLVSRTTSVKRSPPRSKRASCAAFSNAWPTSARDPLNGSSRPTFTGGGGSAGRARSEEHTSELQSLMRHAYAVF